MPENPEDSSSRLTSSGSDGIPQGQDISVVDERLAAEIIGLPYEGWAIIEKRIPKEAIVLTDQMKQFLGGPVSRVMTKYGMGKIAKDEIVIIVTLAAHTFSVVRAITIAKKESKVESKETEN